MPGEHQLHVRMDPVLIKKARVVAARMFKGNLSALVANLLQQAVDKLAARDAAEKEKRK